ncbi:porin family protein [Paraburkholderia phytofirmans]|uniref:hypothetical protein n=1 Tax=Paraburkholderia phytofirmans TaxID=261302 RepID=UPI0038B99D7F
MRQQYSAATQRVGPFESGADWAAVGGLFGAHPGNLDAFDPQNRVANAIKYMSQLYGGFKSGALYSLGGIAGSAGMNRVWSQSLYVTPHANFAASAASLSANAQSQANHLQANFDSGAAANALGTAFAQLANGIPIMPRITPRSILWATKRSRQSARQRLRRATRLSSGRIAARLSTLPLTQ